MLAIKEETFEGTYPFAPQYYVANGFEMHFVDEGKGCCVGHGIFLFKRPICRMLR